MAGLLNFTGYSHNFSLFILLIDRTAMLSAVMVQESCFQKCAHQGRSLSRGCLQTACVFLRGELQHQWVRKMEGVYGGTVTVDLSTIEFYIVTHRHITSLSQPIVASTYRHHTLPSVSCTLCTNYPDSKLDN